MKISLQIKSVLVVLQLLIFSPLLVFAQHLDIESAINITKGEGNNLCPSWSADGQKLVYQSDRNGNWDILEYSLASDTSIEILNSDANERHPSYFDFGKKLVFDSDVSGSSRLYFRVFEKNLVKLLFDREIEARQACFSSTEKLVYFSGFDPLKKKWQIYSFEFYYENLNKLTDLNGHCESPVVSPDEDHVLFVLNDQDYPFQHIYSMNWYGDEEQQLADYHVSDPCWDNSGLKFYFVSKKDNRIGDLFSVWAEGSHLEKLTDTDIEIRHPRVSPDGRYLALSVKMGSTFDILLIPFEDY